MNMRAPRRGRNRRQISSALQPVETNANVTADSTNEAITLDFDKPVILNGIPAGFAVTGLTISAATQTDANTVVLTASGDADGKDWSLTANDPAIRTYQGGYANPAAGTFPA